MTVNVAAEISQARRAECPYQKPTALCRKRRSSRRRRSLLVRPCAGSRLTMVSSRSGVLEGLGPASFALTCMVCLNGYEDSAPRRWLANALWLVRGSAISEMRGAQSRARYGARNASAATGAFALPLRLVRGLVIAVAARIEHQRHKAESDQKQQYAADYEHCP